MPYQMDDIIKKLTKRQGYDIKSLTNLKQEGRAANGVHRRWH